MEVSNIQSVFFMFMDGASPLWWLGLALVLAIFEMLVTAFVLIWPALAAVVVAGLLALRPEMSGDTQVIWFTILSLIFTFIGRYLIRRFGDGGEKNPGLNNRGHALIGKTASVVDVTDAHEGAVQVGDTRWKAVWIKGVPEMDTRVKVIDVDGMQLKVETL